MTRFAIMEADGPADPEFAVHKIEAPTARDALAEYAVSKGYADPRAPREEGQDDYLYQVPPDGRDVMVFENLELVAVLIDDDTALAQDLAAAVAAGDEERMLEVESAIAERLRIDPNETEQGLTEKAVSQIETFVSTALGRTWAY